MRPTLIALTAPPPTLHRPTLLSISPPGAFLTISATHSHRVIQVTHSLTRECKCYEKSSLSIIDSPPVPVLLRRRRRRDADDGDDDDASRRLLLAHIEWLPLPHSSSSYRSPLASAAAADTRRLLRSSSSSKQIFFFLWVPFFTRSPPRRRTLSLRFSVSFSRMCVCCCFRLLVRRRLLCTPFCYWALRDEAMKFKVCCVQFGGHCSASAGCLDFVG